MNLSFFRGKKNHQQVAQPPPAPPQPQQGPTTGPLALGHQGPMPQASKGGDLNLVNYSPEELVAQVDKSLSRVQFGWTWITHFMENYSELWAMMGPVILLVGTVGEIFLVLWRRQKVQDIWTGSSIVAVALVLEGTFLAVSYKAATIRNRAEKRGGGPTDLDKKKLQRQFICWFALAFGVCATQVVFIVAQTRADDIGTYGVWAVAILRAFFTLFADGYTAFAHEEKPTTAEQALLEEEQRTKHAQRFLQQKQQEITIINDGILDVREAHTAALIKDVKLTTRLEVETMQSRAEVHALKAQQEQATMFARLSTGIVRALFDPEMEEHQRQQLLSTMQGFMSAAKLLPEGKIVDEEEEA